MTIAVTVLGGGAWGRGLAALAEREGRTVRLWRRADGLPSLQGAGLAVLAVPMQALRAVAGRLADARPVPLLVAAKGVELGTGLLASEVLEQVLPGWPLAVLSGPTFASEVAAGLPTAVTVAGHDVPAGLAVAALGTKSFRPYRSDDPVGVQLGGAVKNVVAIACGIAIGAGLGENARAALMTRGLAETARLGLALGARAETFQGLAGLGDLALTATSRRSRNFAFGLAMGEGASREQALAAAAGVVEGVPTAAAVLARAARAKAEMPVAAAVDAVVNRGAAIGDAIAGLLARPFKPE